MFQYCINYGKVKNIGIGRFSDSDSGIGDSKEALKYLKGTWSLSLTQTVMPFDGEFDHVMTNSQVF